MTDNHHLPAADAQDATLDEPAEKVRLHGPADIVLAVPYLIRFRPGPGDVVIVFTRQRQHACTAVAQITDPRDLADLWESTSTNLTTTEPAIDGAVMIAYLGPEAVAPLRDLPRDGTPPLREILRVHSGRMWSLTCPDHGPGCPPEGTLLPRETPRFAATFAAVEGTGEPPDRAGLADCLTPGPKPLIAQVQTCLDDLSAPAEPTRCAPDVRTATEWFALLAGEHDRRAEGPASLDVPQAALLLLALQNKDVRDACTIWSDDAAWWLWLELIRHAPPGWIAPVSTLIATTAFQQVRTTQARIAAEHALADTPGYAMAELLLEIIRRGTPARVFTEHLITACQSAPVLSALSLAAESPTAAGPEPRTGPETRRTPGRPA